MVHGLALYEIDSKPQHRQATILGGRVTHEQNSEQLRQAELQLKRADQRR